MLRSGDRQVHADRHLLPHASSQLRVGRQPDAVDQRRRRRAGRHRLAEPQDVRGDRRRGEVAGLDAVHPRHQRQRQARRLCRAQPAGRSDQGQARSRSTSTRSPSVRPTARSGERCWAIPAASSASLPGADPTQTALTEIYEPPAPGFGPRGGDVDAQRRVLGVARERPCGELRPPQVQGRSTGRPPPASIAPKAGRFYQLPGPQLKDVTRSRQRRGELLRLGGLVRHVRPRPQRPDRHGQSQQLDLRAGGRQVHQLRAFPIRWASSPRTSMAASTIPMPAGRARRLWSTYRQPDEFHLEGGKENRAEGRENAASPRSARAVMTATGKSSNGLFSQAHPFPNGMALTRTWFTSLTAALATFSSNDRLRTNPNRSFAAELIHRRVSARS